MRGWDLPTMSDVKAKESSLAASGFSHPDSPAKPHTLPEPSSTPLRTKPAQVPQHHLHTNCRSCSCPDVCSEASFGGCTRVPAGRVQGAGQNFKT